MLSTKAYAAKNATSPLQPFNIERRIPNEHDVLIQILYCGVCHSDIHQARNEWNVTTFPIVPGHEIVGKVTQIGSKVKKFKVGDTVGVGCFVNSCRQCSPCHNQEQQFCEKHVALTYNGTEMDEVTPTFGGYSSQIVVDENYVLTISPKLNLAATAPLLCAGITTYSPLKRYKVGPGKKVAVVGLGGLGHMGVKLAAAMGADVSVLSTSPAKESDAKRLGAHHFYVTKDPKQMAKLANTFDLILDAVSAPHDIDSYMRLLKHDGTLVLVGLPEKPLQIEAGTFIRKRRQLVGSLIGGIRETQEMLDYCAEKNITSDVEVIRMEKINEAYERTIKGDVRYRFVIDMATL